MEARIIEMLVSPDGSGNKLSSGQVLLGYAGEHLATEIQFEFPETWSENSGLRYYVSFLSADGKAYKTDLQEWPVSVLLPAAVTFEGNLFIQVVAVPAGDETLEVKKSSCFKGVIERSLNGPQSLPEDATAGLIEQSLKDFYDAVQKLPECLPYIGDNGNWYGYNAETGEYEDTGSPARGEKGDMGELSDGSVTGVKLGKYSVLTDKVAPKAVTAEKLDDGAVAARTIADDTRSLFAPSLTGYTEGDVALVSDGVPGTLLKSAVVRGKSKEDEATGTITPLSPSVIVASSNDGSMENHADLPTGIQLYSTPNSQYYDTYDVISGILVRNCGAAMLASAGWVYGFSAPSTTITWITANNYMPSKSYYMVHGGVVSTQTTDWQGKISLTVNKADAGITAEDTAATATQKVKTYFGEAYAVLPLKTPTTEQLEPVQLAIPAKECAVVCNNGYLDVTYCRDINTAYLDLLEYTTRLEARIAQLEISTEGGGAV